jgi:hypothetical protein
MQGVRESTGEAQHYKTCWCCHECCQHCMAALDAVDPQRGFKRCDINRRAAARSSATLQQRRCDPQAQHHTNTNHSTTHLRKRTSSACARHATASLLESCLGLAELCVLAKVPRGLRRSACACEAMVTQRYCSTAPKSRGSYASSLCKRVIRLQSMTMQGQWLQQSPFDTWVTCLSLCCCLTRP